MRNVGTGSATCSRICLAALLASVPFLTPQALAQTASAGITPGSLWVEPPTLTALGLEWSMDGDDNRNAQVSVEYRKVGETAWRKALPLTRLNGEKMGNLTPPRADFHPDPNNYTNPNMFAGSVLGLRPGVSYEVRLTLADPDGVRGQSVKTVVASTRVEPKPAAGGHVYHVYPIGWKGPRDPEGFIGLMEAYYQGAASSDFQGTYLPRVKPGDQILVHAGIYKSDRFHYLNGLPHEGYEALSTLFDGTYYLTADGTPEKPIVIKAAGDGEVIFDGDGAQTFFNLMGADYNYFEGITFRNANLVFLLGLKNIAGSSGFTLKNARLYDIGRGVQADWSGSKGFTIVDNSFIGRHDPKRMMGWIGRDWAKLAGFPEMLGGPTGSEYAVKVYGQGHVVAYNYMANWHDAVDIATYGDPDKDSSGADIRDHLPVSIDFYGNDIYNMGDNCIEADGGARNIRVFDNRCFNAPSGALSATPLIGGPVYFYRNIVYNTSVGSVMKVSTAANVHLYQNTFVGEVRMSGSNLYVKNNVVLGTHATAPVYALSSYTNYNGSDFNAFNPNPKAENSFAWNTPPIDVGMEYKLPLTMRSFKTLAEYSAAVGQDKHSKIVTFNVLTKVALPDGSDIARLYDPEQVDFRPVAKSPLIDAGIVLPTINDDFAGRAPDIGAVESGKPLTVYGPRTPVPGSPWGDQSVRSLAGPPAP